MDISNYISDNTILIVPEYIKKEILLKNKKLINIKIMTIKEFKDNSFFTYNINAIYYLMQKYEIKYDIAKMYLDNIIYTTLDIIDDNNMQKLYEIRKDLDNQNLLIYNPYFKSYLKDKKIVVYGCFLNKFESKLINSFNNPEIITTNYESKKHDIYEFDNIEDEIVFVVSKIAELIEQGIDIKKIKLCNVDEDYQTIIKRIFKFFNIPINFKQKAYSFNCVLKFIELLKQQINIEEALEIVDNSDIINYIVGICNEYKYSNYNNEIFIEILVNLLKTSEIDIDCNENAVSCINIEEANKDDYVFLLGFNQGKVPKIYKDEEYISDKIKESLGVDTSISNNIREKSKIKNEINRLNHITISYKLKSSYDTYIKSSLIDELETEIIKNYNIENKFNYSLIYNKITLADDLDKLTKYNIKSDSLDLLYNNYSEIPYKKYNNEYTGINKNKLLSFLDNKLLLSYSSIDNYYRCGFKYYIKNILKLEKYEETFAQLIGNLFHDVLSKAFSIDFDLNKEFNNYLEEKNLSSKETFFINKLKKDLEFIIETIKEQNRYSKFNKELYEEKIYVNKDKNIKITFMGIVDKIKILEENNKNYIAIIDYKTGTLETNLGYTMYGINMQLPVYLYLVNNSSKIQNAEVIGFYLQKIINNDVKAGEDVLEKRKDCLKLNGYSIDDVDLLEKFDLTYQDSKVIKGMKTSSKGFYAYSKVLSKRQIDKLIEIVNEKIDIASTDIIDAKFDINPKRIGNKLIGCEFCKYNDLCYRKEKDIINLEEVKDYSFLGGDIDG